MATIFKRERTQVVLFSIGLFVGIYYMKFSSDPAYWRRPDKQGKTNDDHTIESNVLVKDELADYLSRRVRLLCWIMTGPQNLLVRTIHVNRTWIRRCDTFLYMSSENTDFPTVAVVSHEGRGYLWQKTRGAFEYIYEHHLEDNDWFLKADDDTYVIVENLKLFLSHHDPNKQLYFGAKVASHMKQGYMSGGGGYVLSRNAVKILVEKAFKNPKMCKSNTFVGGSEDVELGKCFENLKIQAGDSRRNKFETFHPLNPFDILQPLEFLTGTDLNRRRWYDGYKFYKKDSHCCSDYSISFHCIPPDMMNMMEYMIYNMHPFDIGYYSCPADIRATLGLPEEDVDA